MKPWIPAAALAIACCSTSFAKDGELESRYWLEDPLRMAATFGVPQHLFSLTSGPEADKLRNLDYAPPQATDLTLELGYGPFQLSWKQPLPQGQGSKRDYGERSYDDFRFEWARERNAVSLYYQTFSGFYTDLNGNMGNFARISSGSAADETTRNAQNAAASAASALPADIVKRPDIATRHYGVILWQALPLVGENAQAFELSLRSMADRPAPGFNFDLLANLFFDRAAIRAGTPFVPEKRAPLFGKAATLKEVDTWSAGAGLGFATSYAFSGGMFALDFAFVYGGATQRQHTTFTDDQRWRTVYVHDVNLRTGLGFRVDRHRAGLHFWTNTVGSRVEDAELSSSNMAVELGYGITI